DHADRYRVVYFDLVARELGQTGGSLVVRHHGQGNTRRLRTIGKLTGRVGLGEGGSRTEQDSDGDCQQHALHDVPPHLMEVEACYNLPESTTEKSLCCVVSVTLRSLRSSIPTMRPGPARVCRRPR